MALPTRCQTRDALYETSVSRYGVSVAVTLPLPLDVTEEEAKMLEANLHNAVELVLAPFFRSV